MEQGTIVKINAIQKSHHLGDLDLYKDGKHFRVNNKNQTVLVDPVLIDPALRIMTAQQLIGFQKHGYVQIGQCNDGSYTLRAKVRGDGGGVWGAALGFWVGKTAVYLVGHGTIAVIAGAVGLVSGPAGLVVGQALESTFAAPIEAASNVVACGTAIATGTATGPV